MSELVVGDQESKPVSECHDPSPQYHLRESIPDALTSIIENERARRLAVEQLMKIATEIGNLAENQPMSDDDFPLMIGFLEKVVPVLKEQVQLMTELSNVLKERIVETPEIYIAMERLSVSEFNQAYASLKRNPNRQIQGELAQKSQDRDNYFWSSGRLIESSTKLDDMNDKPGQSLASYDIAGNVRKASDSAPAKPPRSFWKKFWDYSARLK